MKQSEMMGKTVIVDKHFSRVYRGAWRKWEVVEQQPATGWIVGFRTIWDGYMDCDLDEYGKRVSGDYFVHQTPQNCVLVVFSPRENAVKVPPSGLKIVE